MRLQISCEPHLLGCDRCSCEIGHGKASAILSTIFVRKAWGWSRCLDGLALLYWIVSRSPGHTAGARTLSPSRGTGRNILVCQHRIILLRRGLTYSRYLWLLLYGGRERLQAGARSGGVPGERRCASLYRVSRGNMMRYVLRVELLFSFGSVVVQDPAAMTRMFCLFKQYVLIQYRNHL